MKKGLFKEFNPVTEVAWKQKIQMDLKGADYNQTLLTHTAEGINIKPVYHADSTTDIEIDHHASPNGDWYISQKIYAGNERAANKKAQDALKRGAQGVLLHIPNPSVDLETLLKDLPQVGIQIHTAFFEMDFLTKLYAIIPGAYVHLDIIHQLANNGNWYKNQKSDFEKHSQFLKNFKGYFSNITVNTSTYQQGGANVVQELAYYCAHLNEYLNLHLNEDNVRDAHVYGAFAKAEKRINIDTTIGSNYFMEIAKYRVYRILTQTLGQAYGLDNLKCYITATPSLRNKSLMDYNVNLLRTTTECMSAVLGGADTVYNLAYDAFFNKENEFGSRIARNQLLILKEEAYLNKVSNAADGSYYINSLITELTNKALEIFKSIEKGGGFIQSLFEGTVQKKIKESDAAQRHLFQKNEKVLVGVNKFINQDTALKSEYEVLPFLKMEPRKTLITPITCKRISEDLEKEKMPQG